MSRRTSIHCFAFAKRATVAKSHVIATALLQLVVLEPTRADDVKPNECGLASVYSTLSEETASGQDTSVNDRTAAHRSLPFGTLVRVDNQENGSSAIVRITDRGPFVNGRIVEVSQIAAHELGFADLTKVCLKILSIAEIPPAGEKWLLRWRKQQRVAITHAIQSSSSVAHQLTWINDILEWLVGLPCWQSAVLNVGYDCLLLIGE